MIFFLLELLGKAQELFFRVFARVFQNGVQKRREELSKLGAGCNTGGDEVSAVYSEVLSEKHSFLAVMSRARQRSVTSFA